MGVEQSGDKKLTQGSGLGIVTGQGPDGKPDTVPVGSLLNLKLTMVTCQGGTESPRIVTAEDVPLPAPSKELK